jgi:hypothetical protein
MTAPDVSRFSDGARVAAEAGSKDSILWRPVATVQKYNQDKVEWVAARTGIAVPTSADLERLVEPDDIVVSVGNLLTTAGLNRITSLIIGGGGQAATNTSARLGTGNSTTAAAVGQTDLQAAAGSANRWFQIMDASFPTQSNGVLTFKSTFASADGNYAWQEWCVDIGTPTVSSGNTVAALMLNRKVESLGTKASGASWVLTSTITLS